MNINDNCLALALLACRQCGCQDFWRCWNEICWLKNAYGCCDPCAFGCGSGFGCPPGGFGGMGCCPPGFGGPPHGKGCCPPGFGGPPPGKGCCPPGFAGPSHGKGCCPPGFGCGSPGKGCPSGGFGGMGFAPDPYFGYGACDAKPHDCPPPKSCSCKFCGCKLDGGAFGFKGLGSFFGC